MKFHDSDEYRQAERLGILHTGPSLSREECNEIFREMVLGEARHGRLNAVRRKRLIQYAAALQLTPIEAGRIITQVCRELDQSTVDDAPAIYRFVEVAAPQRWPLWLKIGLTLLAAFAVDRLIRQLI